ncbi:MAG: alpha/beta hydrolase [Moorea sp. SIO2B7]|nr:alpha/beta hydrolase [Moorena sp. SIO2B7]
MAKQNLRRLLLGEFNWKRLMRSLLLIYAFFALYVFFFADGMIFVPQPSSYKDTSDILQLKTSDQFGISAAYLPNPKATYTILFAHGNAEDLGDIQPLLQKLSEIGFSVFAYDYRGYGTSGGTPSERNAYKDVNTAYNYVTQRLGVPPQQIIAYGRSIGGGSMVDLAAREPVGGLIVESSFTSIFRVVLPFPILPFDKFQNLKKIKRVKCPVLIMHGKADRVIPFQHGEKLFAAASEPKLSLWVDEAGHNNLMWLAGEQYAATLKVFALLVANSGK